MIFQHTLEQVLDGTKTQTSRIVKAGHKFCEPMMVYPAEVITAKKKSLYRVGSTYAVQGGRGQKGVARIEITSIDRKDVRSFTDEEIKAEGFASDNDFFNVWCAMHDPDMLLWALKGLSLKTRPKERYQAWVINFNLLKVISHA